MARGDDPRPLSYGRDEPPSHEAAVCRTAATPRRQCQFGVPAAPCAAARGRRRAGCQRSRAAQQCSRAATQPCGRGAGPSSPASGQSFNAPPVSYKAWYGQAGRATSHPQEVTPLSFQDPNATVRPINPDFSYACRLAAACARARKHLTDVRRLPAALAACFLAAGPSSHRPSPSLWLGPLCDFNQFFIPSLWLRCLCDHSRFRCVRQRRHSADSVPALPRLLACLCLSGQILAPKPDGLEPA